MELWMKRYGLWKLSGVKRFFRRFWGNSEIFGVVGGVWHKKQGLLQNLGIFGGVWSGLEPNHNYFSKPRALL
jgi:hypothetical protein